MVLGKQLNLLEFQFLFDDEYEITESMLFPDNHIRLRCNGVYYEVTSYTGDTFSFEVQIINDLVVFILRFEIILLCKSHEVFLKES